MARKQNELSLDDVVKKCFESNKYVSTEFGHIVDWFVNVLEENMNGNDDNNNTTLLTSEKLCDLTNDMLVANAITFSTNETASLCNDIIDSLIKHGYLAASKNGNDKEIYCVGNQCLALFNEDQLYYPCIIKSVLTKNSKYLVEFIGYGNQQITYFDQLMNTQAQKDNIDENNENSENSKNDNNNNNDNIKNDEKGISLLSSIKEQNSTIAGRLLVNQKISANNIQAKNEMKFKNAPIKEHETKSNESKKNNDKKEKHGKMKASRMDTNDANVNNDNNDNNDEFDEKEFENWDNEYNSDKNEKNDKNDKNGKNGKNNDKKNSENEECEDIMLEGESIGSDDERWINRKNDDCELCDRKLPLTWHHLIPRCTHKKIIKLYNRNRDELNKHGIWVCRPCHSAIHGCYDNWTLAIDFNTLELLKESNKINKWLDYICKKNKKLTAHCSDSRVFGKMNRIAQLQQVNKKHSKNLNASNAKASNKTKSKGKRGKKDDNFDSTSVKYV